MRELLFCLKMTSLHVKNNLQNVQKYRKRGGVNAKSAVEKPSKEFIKKEKDKKSCDFEHNLIMSFM